MVTVVGVLVLCAEYLAGSLLFVSLAKRKMPRLFVVVVIFIPNGQQLRRISHIMSIPFASVSVCFYYTRGWHVFCLYFHILLDKYYGCAIWDYPALVKL